MIRGDRKIALFCAPSMGAILEVQVLYSPGKGKS
jgi:hypothetical protein